LRAAILATEKINGRQQRKRAGAGRRAGIPNKASIARQQAVAASGETPLDHMLRVMRDPASDDQRRDQMARACGPLRSSQAGS